MVYPHPFALNGPWQYLAQAGPDDAGLSGQADGPAGWRRLLPAEFQGQLRLIRRFGRPSNLEPTETVWLLIEGAPSGLRALLNGEPLASGGDVAAWDITPRLAVRNELQLVFAVDGRGVPSDRLGAVPRTVRLEVRGPDS